MALLNSILGCSYKPDYIIIVDGSQDNETQIAISNMQVEKMQIRYYKVNEQDRGLTKQRNFGIAKIPKDTEIVAFLDDDIKVEPDYFKELINTYRLYPEAIGAGGLDLKENTFFLKIPGVRYNWFKYYELDGWVTRESARNMMRKLIGMMPSLQPGLIPEYSHGRSSLPPNGLVYEVEHFMGGISSYRTGLFKHLEFSEYFTGYGLYEDFDFCVRALKFGKLYVNTAAKVWHYHESSGRPDFYKYGKMVVRNGWYVWRVRFPNPTFASKIKWHSITIFLAHVRLLNSITGPDHRNAFMDYLGRVSAWGILFFNTPNQKNK